MARPLPDDLSPGSVVNNVIAVRDAALALAAYGEFELATDSLRQARIVAVDSGLNDQAAKIAKIEGELESRISVRGARRRGGLTMSRPPTVVFVHGFLSSGAIWARFLELMDADDAGYGPRRVFDYHTKVAELQPLKRIADLDALALMLGTFLQTEVPGDQSVLLVGHSQGGLLIQKYLHGLVTEGRSAELSRISKVVLFACPNYGSGKFLVSRKWLLRRRNPQEIRLRPFDAMVAEAHRTVVHRIAEASSADAGAFHIPFAVFLATEDDVVEPVSAKGSFRSVGGLPGDHSSVIQPGDSRALNYLAFRRAVLTRSEGEQASGVPPGP